MRAKKIIFIIICHLSFCSCASNNLNFSNSNTLNRAKEIEVEKMKKRFNALPVSEQQKILEFYIKKHNIELYPRKRKNQI